MQLSPLKSIPKFWCDTTMVSSVVSYVWSLLPIRGFVLNMNKFAPEGVNRLECCWDPKGLVRVLKSFRNTRNVRNSHLTSLNGSIIILIRLWWLRWLLRFIGFGESQRLVDMVFLFCDILGPIRGLMKSGVSRRNVAKSELQNLIPVIDWIYLSLYFYWVLIYMSNLHQ